VVRWFNDEETVFVVKPTTMFEKIRGGIAKKHGVENGSFAILHDGRRCTNDVNPKLMEMMAGRTYNLDVQQEQVGGGSVCLILYFSR
jgi:hypothetical protein